MGYRNMLSEDDAEVWQAEDASVIALNGPHAVPPQSRCLAEQHPRRLRVRAHRQNGMITLAGRGQQRAACGPERARQRPRPLRVHFPYGRESGL